MVLILTQVLLSDQPDFACDNLHDNFNFNYTFEQYYNLSVPFENVADTATSRSCRTFDYGSQIFDSYADAEARGQDFAVFLAKPTCYISDFIK